MSLSNKGTAESEHYFNQYTVFFFSSLFVVLRTGEKSSSEVTKKITHLYISNGAGSDKKSINSLVIIDL